MGAALGSAPRNHPQPQAGANSLPAGSTQLCQALLQGVGKLSLGDCQSFGVIGRLGTCMSEQLTFLLCANLMCVEYLVVRILSDTAKMTMGFF